MTGHHLTADLSQCRAGHPALTDAQALRSLCVGAARAAGLTVVGELFKVFPPPGGVTGVVLLAESHLAVHTWPERGVVTLDVYVCNVSVDNSAAAQAVVDALVAAFEPRRQQRLRLLRGVDELALDDPVPAADPPPAADLLRAAELSRAGEAAEAGDAAADRPDAGFQRLPATARPAATPSV